MSESESEVPDPLLDSLGCPPPNEALRKSLFASTVSVVRRRRRLRRASVMLALAGCYLAGIGTASIVARGLPDAKPNASDIRIADRATEQVVEGAIEQASTSPDGFDPLSDPSAGYDPTLVQDATDGRGAPAVLLERWAQSMTSKPRAAMYRRAGDRYLQETGDLEAASRCYSRALDASSEDELVISTEADNWLMMALKQARQKETRHEDNDG